MKRRIQVRHTTDEGLRGLAHAIDAYQLGA